MKDTLQSIINTTDDSFDPEFSRKYDLIFEAGDKTFGYSIRDVETNRFVGLGYFRNSVTDASGGIPWIRSGFHSVKGIIDNAKFTLIPETLYREGENDNYYNFSHHHEPGESVRSDRITHLGIHSVYGLPGHLCKEITRVFPDAVLCHITTHLIHNLWTTVKNQKGVRVFLNLRDGQFDLLVFEDNQLKYCNIFHFLTPEDVAYYVIFVFEQLNLNPEETRLSLLGSAVPFSPVYDLLYRYIRTLGFVSRNDGFNYSNLFSLIPSHSYYTLLNSVPCGS